MRKTNEAELFGQGSEALIEQIRKQAVEDFMKKIPRNRVEIFETVNEINDYLDNNPNGQLVTIHVFKDKIVGQFVIMSN
jgi:hypothetical protein